MARTAGLRSLKIILSLLLIVLAGACNLTSAPQEQLSLTEALTITPLATRTLASGQSVPTTLPITTLSVPTTQPLQFPTSISLPPTFILFPTSTPLPISIFILSPIPGNVVAGNVQVLGAAIHPQFLQYQLEYGPDPNPGNLWYPATGIVQTPVVNGLLGIWNTTVVQDSTYQLRLRVTLRDGTSLATVVNYIRIQNQLPTPIPSATPNIPRPIAAFTQDRTAGQAPLAVKFTSQSSGSISAYGWNFGDGGNSPDANPTHTFRLPGVYTVTLSVAGPGGSSNVSRQINVQSPTAPIAAFTQDKTSGPSPLTVQFTDQSTGSITAYSWNFGDGTTSTDKNPSHQFTAVGTYNIILSVTGSGGTSFVTRKITVQDPVIPPPTASFAVDHNSGNAPLTVQFSNQSSGQITNYNWDFGDGTTSADTNPSHIFTTAGNYLVTLTAIGPGGQNAAQVSVTVNQPPNAPTAAFTENKTSGDIPLAVQFTNQSTGDISSYAWNFGDGGTSTDKDPSHSFATAGTYTVTLTVTGPGGTSSAQVNITATEPIAKPKAAFTANPSTGNAPLIVQFLNQSTGESMSFNWNFGDGTPVSTDTSPTHTYSTPGTYTVTLGVSNSGGTDSIQSNVTVSQAAVPPVAAFSANPTSGNAPLPVLFTNQSTGDISGYSWNFGDGGTSTDKDPSYTFNNAGTFTVTLTVTGAGGSASSTADITVSPAPVAPPVAAFSANPTSGNAPLPVQFTNQSTGDISSYAWNFGDGGTSTDKDPSYTFNNAGTFTVTLTVTGAGGSASSTADITVSPAPVAPPVAAFSANPTSGNAPLPVQFTNQSTGDISGYSWNFGDGGTSTDKDPSYTFNNAGTFTVTLTVTGAGGSASSTADITVSPAPVAPPVAAFSANPTSGNAPLPVQFTNQSTGDISSYAWNFGDGGTSTDKDPSYTFNNAGTFTVTLTVTGAGGSASSTADITVSPAPVAPPVAAFSANPTSGNAPLPVLFTNQSTGDISGYSWNFGDGGTSTDKDPSYSFANAGTFTVTLTVTGAGGSASSTADITVSPAAATPPPINDALTLTTNRDGNNEIYLLGTDGSLTNLTQNGADDNSPSWSPDGSKIAFVSNRDGNNEIYVMNSDGSNPINLTNNPNDDNSPAWSSDGNLIAFVTNRDGNNEVYTMSATNGSNPINVTNDPNSDNNPAPSPDGSKIAFVSNRDGNSEIYVSASDGSFTNISNNAANDTDPSWSSNGQKMLFATDRDGFSQIYVMDADGANPTRLSDNTAQDRDPSWSPNESQIIFVSDRQGGSQIYVMNADGSNVTQVSDGSAVDQSPVWKP